jgi:hypothetical protein
MSYDWYISRRDYWMDEARYFKGARDKEKMCTCVEVARQYHRQAMMWRKEAG